MKKTLAENLLRFAPKNLDAKTIKKLQQIAEQTAAAAPATPQQDPETLSGDARATDIPGGIRLVTISNGSWGPGRIRTPYIEIGVMGITFRRFDGRTVFLLKFMSNAIYKSTNPVNDQNPHPTGTPLRPQSTSPVDLASAITLICEIASTLYGNVNANSVTGAIQGVRYLITNQLNAVSKNAVVLESILQQLTKIKNQSNIQAFAKLPNMNTGYLVIVKQAIDKA
jgi:hypothetical protein